MSCSAYWTFSLEPGNHKESFFVRQLLASILTCGLLLVSCESETTGSAGVRRSGRASVVEVTRALASLLAAGMPLTRALDTARVAGRGAVPDALQDIRSKVERGESPDVHVREVMSSNVHCCRAEDSLDEVENAMAKNQVRRIPIVDENNRVLGMVAQADLARERKAVGTKDLGKVLEKISEPAGVGR